MTVKELIENLDREVDNFNVWIYDEIDENIFGKKFNDNRIRCCIYLEDINLWKQI